MGRKSKGAKIKAETKRFKKAPQRNNQSTTTSSAATPLPSTPTNVYTLADEARNTSQHDHSTWNQSTLLRKKPVLFVSAGLIEPLKWPEDMLNEEDEEAKDAQVSEEKKQKTNKPQIRTETHDASEANDDPVATYGNENTAFFFDVSKPQTATSKSTSIAQAAPTIQLRRTPSISSDSSEEIILFQGRRNRTPTTQDQMSLTNIKIELSAVEDEIKTPAMNGNMKSGTEDDIPNKTQNQPAKSRGRRGGRRARERRQADDENNENDDLLIADYIENMQNSGEMDELTAYIENLQAMQRTTDGLSEDSDAGESSNDEIDDETLRRLIAGQNMDDGRDNEEAAETSSSSEDDADLKFLSGLENYGEFDPMDWERPSIRRKRGKGGKAKLDLNLDNIDSDMERTLQAAWRSDRQKKADRKRERQEMRARGLLGKKANPEDTRIKYPAGMTTDQVADEFRSFLIGDAHSLSLPPMDKHCRKMVHELANKFNVKSKSIGKGDQRRPTLYRTLRTAPFREHAFDQAVNRMTRRYFPRMDQKGKKSGEPLSRSYAATSYRDGDVVGAAAPEIGVENRGRAMLEKMGWSRGTALGTDDNKGILQPVIQTMKKTKAGLG